MATMLNVPFLVRVRHLLSVFSLVRISHVSVCDQ